MRSDARANRDRILAAAQEVFGAGGAGASTEEVARLAGVGAGTVFRHFPTKRDLLEATVLRLFDHLAQEAGAAGATLDGVVRTLVSTGATKLALGNQLGAASPAVEDAARALKAAVDRLLRRGQQAGAVRPDVSVNEVYLIVRALATVAPSADPATTDRALEVVLAGLRRT